MLSYDRFSLCFMPSPADWLAGSASALSGWRINISLVDFQVQRVSTGTTGSFPIRIIAERFGIARVRKHADLNCDIRPKTDRRTSRWSQLLRLSRLVLTHESRQLPLWLIIKRSAQIPMSIWRKILGQPTSPSVPEPSVGWLHILTDENSLLRHQVVSGYYNVYQQGDHNWLTLQVRAKEACAPCDSNSTAWLELNMSLARELSSPLIKGAVLNFPASSKELGNLTSMFYHTHESLEDAVLTVEEMVGTSLLVRIKGVQDHNPVVVRCDVAPKLDLKRTFR